MTRTAAFAIIVLLLAAWGGAGVLVYRLTGPERLDRSAVPPSSDVADGEREPLPLSRWSESPPDLVLFFTGQQEGRLKPCGCSPAFQKGGLAKRGAFLSYVRQKGWPVVAVDLGGLVDNPQQSYGLLKYIPGPEHRLAKLEVSLQALSDLGYAAVGLGPQDANLESGLLTYVSVAGEFERPVVTNCNLSIPADLQEVVKPFVVLEQADFKIGVLAAVGKDYKSYVKDQITPLVWEPPADAISAWLPKLSECDLRVLLFYGNLDEARQLARTYSDFDIIIHAEESEEPLGQEVWEGQTLLATVGRKGMYAGAVGVWRGEQPKMAFELTALDARFDDDPAMRKLVYDVYLQKLAGLDLVSKLVKKPLPEGASVAGVDACVSCHPRTVAKWRQSKHALALEALRKTGEHVNPECLACHTTMFGYRGGYDGTPATAHLGGNQCENCHGPAGQHVRDPDNVALRQALHREAVSAEARLCKRCHDPENDPKFSFSVRWPEVVHTQEARKDALEYRRKRR